MNESLARENYFLRRAESKKDDELASLQFENAELRRKLDELQNMLTACGFEVIEDYDKRKAIKGHGLIYMQEKTE